MPRIVRCLPFVAACLSLALFSPTQVQAQKKGGGRNQIETSSIFTRSNPQFLSAFREVVAPAAKSTVRVVADGKDVALGMVVDPNGWILTKANDLKGDVECKIDGKSYDARLVGLHRQHDLALLKIDATGLTPVKFADSKVVPVGNWVALPGTEKDPVGVGVVSVATRHLPNNGGPISVPSANGGYLGIQLDEGEGGVKITQIMPKTPAADIGLKANDVIIMLQGKSVIEPDGFMELMQGFKAGDTVTLKVKRGDEELEFKPKLVRRPFNRGDFQNTMGSELSSRRSGYPTILQHDSVVKPADCGGPIVDLDGRVIGINICRAGRTESWAVPAEVIQPLLAELKSGKLPPPAGLVKTPLTPEQKLAKTQEDLRKAETDLRNLAETLKKAEADRAALEKTIRSVQEQIGVKEKSLLRLRTLLEDLKKRFETAPKKNDDKARDLVPQTRRAIEPVSAPPAALLPRVLSPASPSRYPGSFSRGRVAE